MFGFHWYGLLIGVGVLVSIQTSVWLAKRRGVSQEILWNGAWWALIGGLIGARLYHVFDLWREIYSLDPISVLYIWNGGLGIFGGIIGGFLGLLIYYKFFIHHPPARRIALHEPRTNSSQRRLASEGGSSIIHFHSLLDLVFFGLPLGQAVGRLGNWVNQEVYGPPTTLPWGIYIRPENRLPQYANYSAFHPLFAYEALWNLLGFALMLISELLRHSDPDSVGRRIPPGSFTAFYLIWYGLGRFGLDFLRPPEFSWTLANLNLGQLFSLILILAGSLIWIKSPLITPKH